jgi:hypothetical protein
MRDKAVQVEPQDSDGSRGCTTGSMTPLRGGSCRARPRYINRVEQSMTDVDLGSVAIFNRLATGKIGLDSTNYTSTRLLHSQQPSTVESDRVVESPFQFQEMQPDCSE